MSTQMRMLLFALLVAPLTRLVTFRPCHEPAVGCGCGQNDLFWVVLCKAAAVMVKRQGHLRLFPSAPTIRKGPWRASLIWGLITILAVPPVLLLAMPLLMMFDAPGSSENLWTRLILTGVLILPLLCALIPLLLWALYGLGSNWPHARPWLRRVGHGMHALPLLSPFTVVVGVIGLQLQCGGSFNCLP